MPPITPYDLERGGVPRQNKYNSNDPNRELTNQVLQKWGNELLKEFDEDPTSTENVSGTDNKRTELLNTLMNRINSPNTKNSKLDDIDLDSIFNIDTAPDKTLSDTRNKLMKSLTEYNPEPVKDYTPVSQEDFDKKYASIYGNESNDDTADKQLIEMISKKSAPNDDMIALGNALDMYQQSQMEAPIQTDISPVLQLLAPELLNSYKRPETFDSRNQKLLSALQAKAKLSTSLDDKQIDKYKTIASLKKNKNTSKVNKVKSIYEMIKSEKELEKSNIEAKITRDESIYKNQKALVDMINSGFKSDIDRKTLEANLKNKKADLLINYAKLENLNKSGDSKLFDIIRKTYADQDKAGGKGGSNVKAAKQKADELNKFVNSSSSAGYLGARSTEQTSARPGKVITIKPWADRDFMKNAIDAGMVRQNKDFQYLYGDMDDREQGARADEIAPEAYKRYKDKSEKGLSTTYVKEYQKLLKDMADKVRANPPKKKPSMTDQLIEGVKGLFN